MFIIPAERGIDWRRAPVVTAAIIVLCSLVYFGWQWDDDQRLQRAAEFYMDAGLPELEYPNYLSYLHQHGRGEQAAQIEELWEADHRYLVVLSILQDLQFAAEMARTDSRFWGEDIYHQWRAARDQVNAMVAELSAVKLGLTPAQSRPITYLSYQFLHGDSLHLIGNMVMLALTGVAVEAAIGSTYFLLSYLFCGLCAGLVFSLFNWQGYLPLVGASGAISGVMGMYAALYGLRRIRFFYSLVFYFGYFTAPALVMLPVWLLWEVINAVWGGNDGIAYSAHAGGLLAGGLGMLVGRRYLVQVEEDYLDQAPDEEEEYRRTLDDFLKQLAAFQFDAAERKLQQLEARYPDHNQVLEQRYLLLKLRPAAPQFHAYAHQLLARPVSEPAAMHMLLDVYSDYQRFNRDHPLPAATLLKLMLNFCQIAAWDTVQGMVKEAQQRRLRDPMLVKVLRLLSRGMSDQGERALGRQFGDMADNLEQSLQTT
ncbi:MAG: rhomboid family intramembrane serine protease [Pseudomonadales bacterium]|nr:rhomboid family intramembrane serine protease [Pseudomonadales bacterium]